MKQLFTLLLLLVVQLAYAQQAETFLGGAFKLSFIEQGQSGSLQTFSNSERSSFELELRPYLYREKPSGSGTGYGLVLGMHRTTRSDEEARNEKKNWSIYVLAFSFDQSRSGLVPVYAARCKFVL